MEKQNYIHSEILLKLQRGGSIASRQDNTVVKKPLLTPIKSKDPFLTARESPFKNDKLDVPYKRSTRESIIAGMDAVDNFSLGIKGSGNSAGLLTGLVTAPIKAGMSLLRPDKYFHDPTKKDKFTNSADWAKMLLEGTGKMGLDAFTVLPVAAGIKSVVKSPATKAVVNQTYKINPWAEKFNGANSSYRVAGMDAYKDAIASRVIRSVSAPGARPTPFPSFQKGFADLRYLPEEGGVVIKTNVPTFRRGDANPVTGKKLRGGHYAHRPIDLQTGDIIKNLPIDKVSIYGTKPHWLKGYPKLSTAPNETSVVRHNLFDEGITELAKPSILKKIIDAKVIPTKVIVRPKKLNFVTNQYDEFTRESQYDAFAKISAVDSKGKSWGHISLEHSMDDAIIPSYIKVHPNIEGLKMQDALYQSGINVSKKYGYHGIQSGDHLLSPAKTHKAWKRFEGYEGPLGTHTLEPTKILTGHKNPKVIEDWLTNYNNNVPKITLGEKVSLGGVYDKIKKGNKPKLEQGLPPSRRSINSLEEEYPKYTPKEEQSILDEIAIDEKERLAKDKFNERYNAKYEEYLRSFKDVRVKPNKK